MGIDGTCAIAENLNIILLSKLATEKEVGLYSAATQMMVPLLLVYQSISQSIFPVMCRQIEPGLRTLRRISEQAMEVLLMLAVPTIAGIFFVGQWALSVVYKNPTFVEAVPALHILSWMLVSQVFSSILGQVLVATHREKLTLKIAMASAIVNLGVGWPLILRFGLRGAALRQLAAAALGSTMHYIPVARQLSGISLLKIIWKPIVAAGCMTVYLSLAITRFGYPDRPLGNPGLPGGACCAGGVGVGRVWSIQRKIPGAASAQNCARELKEVDVRERTLKGRARFGQLWGVLHAAGECALPLRGGFVADA